MCDTAPYLDYDVVEMAATRVRAAAVFLVTAMIALVSPRIAQADGPAAPPGRADVADHLRVTGFAVSELVVDFGFARAPRLYIWDPLSRERALPVTGPDLASALVVLHCDW